MPPPPPPPDEMIVRTFEGEGSRREEARGSSQTGEVLRVRFGVMAGLFECGQVRLCAVCAAGQHTGKSSGVQRSEFVDRSSMTLVLVLNTYYSKSIRQLDTNRSPPGTIVWARRGIV